MKWVPLKGKKLMGRFWSYYEDINRSPIGCSGNSKKIQHHLHAQFSTKEKEARGT